MSERAARRRGEEGERRAAKHLARRGYEIVMRNFSTRGGEIDIIALKKETLVFVEVRTRAEGAMVKAAESVTPLKRGRVKRAAAAYLARHPEARNLRVRYDVVAIDGRCVEHIEGAFL